MDELRSDENFMRKWYDFDNDAGDTFEFPDMDRFMEALFGNSSSDSDNYSDSDSDSVPLTDVHLLAHGCENRM